VKTDAKIKENVLSELKRDPEIKEELVGITVHHGAVTLTGHIPTYHQKVAAKEAAKRVADVRGQGQRRHVDRRSSTAASTQHGKSTLIANGNSTSRV